MSNFNIDTSSLKSTLNRLDNKRSKGEYLWKPNEGTQKIRLVPYKYNKTNPFIELMFHYNIPGKNWLSPASDPIGEYDPIYDFTEKLKNLGDTQSYNMARDIEPKLRTYAPVIVRGEESKGVRYWGFGKTIYKELVGMILDEDQGDYLDPHEGMDIKVKYIPRDQSPTQFPQTEISPVMKPRPLTTDEDKIESWLRDQVKITEVFDIPTTEELEELLEDFKNAQFDEDRYNEMKRNEVLGYGFITDDELEGDDEETGSATAESSVDSSEMSSPSTNGNGQSNGMSDDMDTLDSELDSFLND